jgi:phosphate transport system permease protein
VAGAVFSRRADNELWHPFEAYTALPIQIYDFVIRPQPEFAAAAAAAIILLMAILMVLNSAAIVLRNRYSRRW